MALRLAFMGTSVFSVPILKALVAAGHDIVAVYSQPPRSAGRRGLDITKSPVQHEAEMLRLTVHTPRTLRNTEEQARFRALSLDAIIAVAYGLLLPRDVLDAPRFGCFNAHASLLPRWRGAAPIQRAIMAGDTETGIMIMQMDEGFDTGPVALAEKVAIGQDMTAGELHDRLSQVAADLMVKAMADLEQGRLLLTPQREESVTYAYKISKEETRIDWGKPATVVYRHICGLSPFPGAWCEMDIAGRRERVKILGAHLAAGQPVGRPSSFDPLTLAVSCCDGALLLTRLQKAGGRSLDVQDFIRGATVTAVY
ncbi:MAG: methionyl-tRNA formyltransferase [Candidatus Tokpelaia sp. JSC189]|nr:MAG: methionyl-tRNA formyltransferase [Candidatus Tokpelaia sp. JSC189]